MPSDDALWMPLADAATADVAEVGGKARALGQLIVAGLPVPEGIVITAEAYRRFVSVDELAARIALAVERKPAEESRWEELWDASERVRTAFRDAEIPPSLREALAVAIAPFGDAPVVVRSSSPQEDASERSFAGLHDSVVGVTGEPQTLAAVETVWASLWSDRAQLYRAETGQQCDAAMAVVVQRLATSERAGVAFTRAPADPARGVVEAVWGLGEGLVSGAVEPDHWEVDRATGRLAQHVPASERVVAMTRGPDGAILEPLPDDLRAHAPLDAAAVAEVWSLASQAEALFGQAQDTEWAYDEGTPRLTQARPITVGLPEDERRWYLTLTPSMQRLTDSRVRIEREILPAMRATADTLAAVDVHELEDVELAELAEVAEASVRDARRLYRNELIAFAHGARLFGSFYNARFAPEDPFEFTRLLVRDSAGQRVHGELLAALGIEWEPPPSVDDELAAATQRYLGEFAEVERDVAREMLELGRASWALRDDDNLYLDLIERQGARVMAEVERRVAEGAGGYDLGAARESLAALAAGALDSNRSAEEDGPVAAPDGDANPRQLVGQPAGPGIAEGTARIVRTRADFDGVGPGDIVVIDALEPDTAAFAVHAGGIVERRGGMLVHGAIVAREWGLACVTGVPHATSVITDGEPLVVDGYLGIVTRTSV